MASAIVGSWQHPQQWHMAQADPRPHFQYAQPQPQPQPPPSPPLDAPVPPRNEVELTRDRLISVLTHFSTLIPSRFGGLPVRLVVHGGACMLLHPGLYNLAVQQHHTIAANAASNSSYDTLPRRTTTRDVDYILRSFVAEWQQIGIMDAKERLQSCIQSTARQFHLGADWMNSDADVALPMAKDSSGQSYDPIYTASIQPNNIHLHTVFTSPNRMLTLISVAPFWSVALKLVRYAKWDPGDICLLLRNGTNLSRTQWTPQTLESWLHQQCWPMNYDSYDWRKKMEMKARIEHAIHMVSNWTSVPAVGNPKAMIPHEPVVAAKDQPKWIDPNPPFVPPPHPRPPTVPDEKNRTGKGWHPAQLQHNPTGSAWPGRLPSPQINRRSKSHAPTPDPDDWDIVTPPRPKSRQIYSTTRPSTPPLSKPHPHLQLQRFDRSMAAEFHNDQGPVIPAGVFAKRSDVPDSSSRKKRQKKRTTHLKSDRLSKWFRRGYNSADEEYESDDPDESQSRGRSQHLHPLDLNRHITPQDRQQQTQRRASPRPSPWTIYAQPGASQARSVVPHAEQYSHPLLPHQQMAQMPDVNMHRHRHRPPPLDISDTEMLSNTLGLLNF